MRDSCLGRLLAALGWILSPSLLAAEIRFEPPITADQAQRWETAIRENWASWGTRYGGPVPRPALSVTTTSVSEMPVAWGRSRGGHIELNRSLTSGAADTVVLHELAHVFLESRCGEVSRRAPLLSEAFALWATGEADSRAFQGGQFPCASAARERLRRSWTSSSWTGCHRTSSHRKGVPLVPFPPGSILKPTFFASVPGLMAERPAGTGRDVQDPETLDVPTRRPGEPEKSPLQR